MQTITYPIQGRGAPPSAIPRILECGFRFLKDFDGTNEPTLTKSVIGWVEGRNQAPKGTIEVELLETTNPTAEASALIGKRFVIGQNADQIGGKPLFRCGKQSKVELCLPLVLAGIGSKHISQRYQTIPRLVLSLPDIDSFTEANSGAEIADRQRLVATTTGTHTYRWNGTQLTRTIEEANVVYEGHGIYDWGLWHGLVPDADLLIVDIGGRTCNLLAVDGDGEVIPNFHASFEVGGTLNLANRIASDADFKAKCGSGAKLEVIMDAIANAFQSAKDSSEIEPVYGAGVNAISFKPEFEHHRSAWIEQLFGELDTRLKDHWQRFGRALIGGGSAHLLSDRLQGQDFFVVPPEPQTAHIKGLMLRHEPNLAPRWVKGVKHGF